MVHTENKEQQDDGDDQAQEGDLETAGTAIRTTAGIWGTTAFPPRRFLIRGQLENIRNMFKFRCLSGLFNRLV